MIKREELTQGSVYLVNGTGNDIFKKGERVLFKGAERTAYVFSQGSIDYMVTGSSIENFLSAMDFERINLNSV